MHSDSVPQICHWHAQLSIFAICYCYFDAPAGAGKFWLRPGKKQPELRAGKKQPELRAGKKQPELRAGKKQPELRDVSGPPMHSLNICREFKPKLLGFQRNEMLVNN